MPTDPEFWRYLFDEMTPGAKLILFGMLIFFLLAWRAISALNKQLEVTKEQATLAAVRSEPTGNGFAQSVQDKLDALISDVHDLKEGQARSEERLDRVEAFGRDRHPEAADELDSSRLRRRRRKS